MLPDGWKEKSFGDVVNVANGLIDPREASFKNTKHIGPENVISDTGRIVNERTCGDLKLISGKYQFDKNSIVYSKIRPNLNKVCAPSYSGVCSADMYVLRPREEIDKNFLFFIILDDSFKNRAISMSMRTGMPKINREDLSSIPLLLPPLPEQKKIAAILSTWDRAIEGTEKLLANSQQQKKALMQQLLTGKKRLPGFSGEWEKTNIGNIAKEISIRNKNRKDYPVISCTKTKGFVDSLSFFNKKVYSDDLSGYKIISRNQIGFPSNHVEEGSIGLQNLHDNAIVSPIYTIFSMEENADPLFVFAVLKTDHYRQIFAAATNSSVDRRGSLRWSAFSQIKINLPSLPEQKAIAAVLTTADEEITALESDLSRLRQEKKALMQQLLTGKRRVKVD